MRVRALLKRVTLLRSRSALSATLPPISGRGRFFGQKNTLRGRPSGRRPPARQKAAHIWRDRDRLHTCRGNRARAPGRKPPQPSRVEARTQIRHAASPGEGARGWGSERASHHMGLGAAASASGAVEPKGGLVSCWGAHRGSCQPWGPALAEHRARAQHAGRSAAAVGGRQRREIERVPQGQEQHLARFGFTEVHTRSRIGHSLLLMVTRRNHSPGRCGGRA